MTLEDLVSKYIRSCKHALAEVESTGKDFDGKVAQVIDAAKRYLEDAEFYRSKGRLDVSLASVAYSEGLLDALKLLDTVKFSWRTER